jgi:IclR family transcriptional regulator, KDG regulon repressor
MSMLSLKRGLDILTCFDQQNEQLSAQQIAALLEVPLSTVYRYLEILTEQQFLTKDPANKLYHLGTTMLRLVRLAGNELPVVTAATPYMEALARDTDETVFLTVLVNYRSVCVKKIESKRRVRLTIDEGTHQALHAGASSRILLAYQSDRFFEQWLASEGMPRFTDHTICDPQTMKQEIERIRVQGYTASDGETDEGAMAVAAPVFGSSGKLRAGLSVAGPSERLTGQVQLLAKTICAYAGRISAELGYITDNREADRSLD